MIRRLGSLLRPAAAARNAVGANVRGGAAVAFLAAALLAAGCASEKAAEIPRQPYKVVLLPVEGAARALADTSESAPENGAKLVPLAFTPEQFEKAVAEGVHASDAFSEIVDAPAAVRVSGDAFAGDELSAASEYARKVGADLILRVTVKSAKFRDAGNNSSSIYSTALWFMVPLPVWTVDDRTYETNLAVEAALYEPRDTVKPTASVVATSDKQDLDLWDRGLSWWVPIIPPPYLEGDPKKVSAEVTRRAMADVMKKLSEELRTRDIPSRFDLAVEPSADGVTVTAASRRQLRSIEVYVDGKLVRTWAETELVADKGSTAERRVYKRSVPVGAKAPAATPRAPAEVRVVAEDEAGGREVRTITIGGQR